MVKWFSFDNTNAPQLTNAWGCLIDVLDACLISGFGSQNISSLVVSNGVAKATFGTAHNFKQFQVVEVSGVTQTVLNGEFKIIGLTSTTIEFLVSSPDLTATGTISAKLAPLGWSKSFSGTQKAVYRAKDTSSNPYFLRVDNSLDPVYNTNYAKFAKVGILETCTGIDDLSGKQVPYDNASPNKNWIGTGSAANAYVGWSKWIYAYKPKFGTAEYGAFSDSPDNGARDWILIGNEQSFFLLNAFDLRVGKTNYRTPVGFFILDNGIVKRPVLAASTQYTYAGDNFFPYSGLTESAQGFYPLLRGDNSLNSNSISSFLARASTHSGYQTGLNYQANLGILLSAIPIKDDLSNFLGNADLIYWVGFDQSNYSDKQLIVDNNEIFIIVKCRQTSSGTTYLGCYAFHLGHIE